MEPGGRCYGSVGPVMTGVEVKFGDDGEILCKGANVMMGYYNKPELTTKQMVAIEGAVQQVVNDFDFSDTENYEIDYGIDYDGKVHCESHDLNETYQLVEMITARVHRLFTEAECPTEEQE